MLTHMHMVVYTWWCWHIYKRVEVRWRRKRRNSWIVPLPSAELARQDLANFRKCSSLFLVHRTLVSGAPDASGACVDTRASLVVCDRTRPVPRGALGELSELHRTLAEKLTGR